MLFLPVQFVFPSLMSRCLWSYSLLLPASPEAQLHSYTYISPLSSKAFSSRFVINLNCPFQNGVDLKSGRSRERKWEKEKRKGRRGYTQDLRLITAPFCSSPCACCFHRHLFFATDGFTYLHKVLCSIMAL